MLVIMLLVWVVLCIIVGVGASNRNRFGFGWFLFAFFLSPLVAGFALLLLGAKSPHPIRSDGLGSVEARSPFRAREVSKPKQGDWSNVAWTPEQQEKQQLIQADKARLSAKIQKEQEQFKIGLAVAGVIVVIALVCLNFA
jgi:hypothetical protein